MKRPTVVYLACPMRIGLWPENMRKALLAAERLRVKGYVPIVPVLFYSWEVLCPRSVEDALIYDYGLINVSDCLLRLIGQSEGADLEMVYAVRHDKPVFTSEIELYQEMPNEIEKGK